MGQILSLSYSGLQECQKILYVSMFSFMLSCLKVLMHLCVLFFLVLQELQEAIHVHITCLFSHSHLRSSNCFHLAWILFSWHVPGACPQTSNLSPFTNHAFVRGTNSQSQPRRSCTANRWFRLRCSQQVSGIETSSIAIGSTILFHSPHAALVLCWRLSVVAFNDDNPFSC